MKKKSKKTKKRPTKRAKKKVVRKTAKKTARKSIRKIVIHQEKRGLGRIAAEHAAGGAGLGFGWAAGHEAGEWAFGD